MCKIIELKNIEKAYGKLSVLKKISFSVNKGEIVTIKGKSGSGKSTLVNILGFIDKYDSGQYLFDLQKVKRKKYSNFRNESIGFVFQNYNLISGLSVIDNIKIPYLYSKKSFDNYLEHLNFLLSFLKIEDLTSKNVADLSGGEKQRVAICRALSLKPKLLLADEPTGNLDPLNKKIILDIFKQVNEYYGITILIVTHDDIFDEISDRNFKIEDGYLYEEN